jgi:hypothetical protein
MLPTRAVTPSKEIKLSGANMCNVACRLQSGPSMRSGALLLFALLLSAATGILSPSVAQDSPHPQTSFPGEFDPLLALAVLYGAGEPRIDARIPRLNYFQIGGDFIEPLYEAAYVEGGIDKHVVIATLTPRPRSEYYCHACAPMLGGAVFRRDGEMWTIESGGLKIEQGHAWSDDQHEPLMLVRIGPDRYGLLHLVNDVSGGGETKRASLIFGVDGVLASRLAVPPVDGPGPGACGMPTQHLNVNILESAGGDTEVAAIAGRTSTDSGAGFYSLVVDALWNEGRCEPVEGGTRAKSSGRACHRTTRYRYREGIYVQTDVETNICTRLPERMIDFRG